MAHQRRGEGVKGGGGRGGRERDRKGSEVEGGEGRKGQKEGPMTSQ